MSIFRNVLETKQFLLILLPIWKKLLSELLSQQGITEEKSALEDFTEKYTIDGEPGVMPIKYFKDKARQI